MSSGWGHPGTRSDRRGANEAADNRKARKQAQTVSRLSICLPPSLACLYDSSRWRMSRAVFISHSMESSFDSGCHWLRRITLVQSATGSGRISSGPARTTSSQILLEKSIPSDVNVTSSSSFGHRRIHGDSPRARSFPTPIVEPVVAPAPRSAAHAAATAGHRFRESSPLATK